MDSPAGLRTGKMCKQKFQKSGAHLDVNKCLEEIGAGVHLSLRFLGAYLIGTQHDKLSDSVG